MISLTNNFDEGKIFLKDIAYVVTILDENFLPF